MNKKYTGGRGRRTSTPADRHKRIVASRHFKNIKTLTENSHSISIAAPIKPAETKKNFFTAILDKFKPIPLNSEDQKDKNVKKKSAYKAVAGTAVPVLHKIEDTVLKTVSKKEETPAETKETFITAETLQAEEPEAIAETPIEEDTHSAEEPIEQEISVPAEPIAETEINGEQKEETAEEIKEESEQTVQKLTHKDKKQIKKKNKEAVLDALIAEPKKRVFSIIGNPIGAINIFSEVEQSTMSSSVTIILPMIKWILIGLLIAIPVKDFIQPLQYSFVRMNFTDMMWFAIRLSMYGMLMEYASNWIIKWFGSDVLHPLDKVRMMSLVTYSLPAVILLLVAALLLETVNTLLGIFFASAVCILAGYLKFYAFVKAGVKPMRLCFLTFVLLFIFILFGWYFLQFCCGDVFRLFAEIFTF